MQDKELRKISEEVAIAINLPSFLIFSPLALISFMTTHMITERLKARKQAQYEMFAMQIATVTGYVTMAMLLPLIISNICQIF